MKIARMSTICFSLRKTTAPSASFAFFVHRHVCQPRSPLGLRRWASCQLYARVFFLLVFRKKSLSTCLSGVALLAIPQGLLVLALLAIRLPPSLACIACSSGQSCTKLKVKDPTADGCGLVWRPLENLPFGLKLKRAI